MAPRSNRRRRFLISGLAAGGAAAAAWRWWPDSGFINPCRAELPAHLARHELVTDAWADIDPAQVWDCHAHLAGTGDSGGGAWINGRTESLLQPLQYARRLLLLNAACAQSAPRLDRSYAERMRSLAGGMPPGFKVVLLAFDHAHDEAGSKNLANSTFFTPNAYARDMARQAPEHFEWAASIHPYRADCIEALAEARRDGAVAVKWLPAAMGMDPASPRCDRFFAALARMGLPLITHAGKERATEATDQDLGNPLRLRRALEHGVRVVVAHCASLGEDRDLDRGAGGPHVPSFSLFARLMDDPRYEGTLYGDLSAITQIDRADPALKTVMDRREWHSRLLYGSDYPLPGVMPLYSAERFAREGWLEHSAVPVLNAIRGYNPLLFDFALKRHLAVNGRRLASRVFETRGFFAREQPAGRTIGAR